MKYSDITKLKHLAQDKKSRSANPAIVRASTILFKSMQEIIRHEKLVKQGKKVDFYEYGRGGSQTTIALQNFIAELEGAHHVFLTPTGFAAVTLSIMSVCRPGDEIIVTDACYHPTRMITSGLLKEFEVKTQFYNPDDFESLKEKITEKTKMIFVENPGSNTFEFQDLSKIVALAKKNKILTAMDNTWATPYFFKPIKFGFDMSIVAATKYYSGHSDVMGGSLAVNKRVFKYVEKANKVTGLRLSPDDAYLITRGIRSLDVRLDKHQENAKKVANFLIRNKKILEVLYPIKKNTQRYKMWKKYYSGASGLLGLKIKSKNKRSVIKFVNSLKLFGYGYSWGGFESLALYQDVREQGNRKFLNLKKDEHLVRLHIGLEDPKDLILDLKRSLKFIK